MNYCCCCGRKRKSCDSSPEYKVRFPLHKRFIKNKFYTENIHFWLLNEWYFKAEHLDTRSNEGSRTSFDSEEEKLMLKSGMDNLDIKEWRMELRENVLCMEEGNILAKRQKLKESQENYEDDQKQQQDDENKKDEIEKKRKSVEDKEIAIANERENLRRLQFEVSEKNAIMEIVLKMNNQTEKLTLNIGDIAASTNSNSSCPSVTGSENSGDQSEGDQQLRLTRTQQEQALLTVRERRLEVCTVAIYNYSLRLITSCSCITGERGQDS